MRNCLLRCFWQKFVRSFRRSDSGFLPSAYGNLSFKVFSLFASASSQKAIDFHTRRNPFQEGQQVWGMVDRVTSEDGKVGFYGWLLHYRSPIVSLTFFDQSGAPYVSQYALPRTDVSEPFSFLPYSGLCGFFCSFSGEIEELTTVSFRAIMADGSISFGTLPLPEEEPNVAE